MRWMRWLDNSSSTGNLHSLDNGTWELAAGGTRSKMKGRGGNLQRSPAERATAALRGVLLVAAPGGLARSPGFARRLRRHLVFPERTGTTRLGRGGFDDGFDQGAGGSGAVILWSP